MSSLSVVHAARVVRAGRIALTHAALGALCVTAFTPFAPAARAANPESCAEPDAASARRLLEVVALVSRGDITELRLYADSAFATPARATNTDDRARDADLIAGELALNAWRSRGWRMGASCAAPPADATEAAAGAIVRNALSGEFDSVAVRVDVAAPHRVRKVAIHMGTGTPVAAEDTSSDALRVATVDRLARRLAAAGAFSGVVLIARDGVPVYYEAFGEADRLRHVPMRRDARFAIGALGETLTAAAVLQQVEARRLALRDTLGALLGDAAPAGARGVRVDELLAHTAQMTVRALGRDAPRAFARDAEDYRTLGAVLAAASGRRWEDYLRECVLDSAGMTSTQLAPPPAPVNYAAATTIALRTDPDAAQRVVGYAPAPTTMGVMMQMERVSERDANPATGVHATAMDLLRFAESLRRGTLLRSETVELMRAPKPALGADGYGFGIVRWRGEALWGSAGDPPGGDADLEIYGESGYVAVILSNVKGANESLRRRLAAVMPVTRLGEVRASASQ